MKQKYLGKAGYIVVAVVLLFMAAIGILVSPSTQSIEVVAAQDSQSRLVSSGKCDYNADQVEINAAIQSLPNGGKVELDGKFLISGSILVRDNLLLVGQGKATEIKLADKSNCSMIAGTGNYVEIAYLTLEGNGMSQAGNPLQPIFIQGNYNSVHNIHAKNGWGQYGVCLSGSFNLITDNTFFKANADCRNGPGEISDNQFYNLDNLQADAVVVLSGSSRGVIANNLVWVTNKAGLLVSACSNGAIVSGNSVYKAALHGIYASNSPYTQINNNRFEECGTTNSHAGVTLNSDYCQAVGNYCLNCVVGVYLFNKYCLVSSNECVGLVANNRQQFGVRESYPPYANPDFNLIAHNKIVNFLTTDVSVTGANTIVEK